MTLKTVLSIISLVLSAGVYLLIQKNKKESEEIKKRKLERVNQIKKINLFEKSIDFNHPISSSVITLLENFNEHKKVGKKLYEEEIKTIEQKLKLSLPISYKIFLKYFGDGGYWVFNQAIDNIQNYSWLKDYRKDLNYTIELVGEKSLKVSSLLCLMTEDSNGGAWCWLTSEIKKDGEWPLAYYSFSDKRLHYKVENFIAWLKILTETKYEVIRELDIEEKLGLG
jgi:hypothetical protein